MAGAAPAITLDVNNAMHYYLRVIVSFKDADTEALRGRAKD
jgi:hypothetical protein